MTRQELVLAAQRHHAAGGSWHDFWKRYMESIDALKLSRGDRMKLHNELMDAVLGIPVRDLKEH